MRAVKPLKIGWVAVASVVSVLLFAAARQVCFPDTQGPQSVAYLVMWGLVFWGGVGLTWKPKAIIKQAAACFLVSALLIALLWRVPWTPRQVFFRHVGDVSPGMAQAAVEEKLSRYRAVYPHQFNGRNGPSARPLPLHFSGAVLYLRGSRDPIYNDYATVVFKTGKAVLVRQIAD